LGWSSIGAPDADIAGVAGVDASLDFNTDPMGAGEQSAGVRAVYQNAFAHRQTSQRAVNAAVTANRRRDRAAERRGQNRGFRRRVNKSGRHRNSSEFGTSPEPFKG